MLILLLCHSQGYPLCSNAPVGNRAFYRWLTRDYRPLFPRLPERTRLFRLFRTHQDWTRAFLAAPTDLPPSPIR